MGKLPTVVNRHPVHFTQNTVVSTSTKETHQLMKTDQFIRLFSLYPFSRLKLIGTQVDSIHRRERESKSDLVFDGEAGGAGT